MAKLEPVEGDRSSRSKRTPRSSSSAAGVDWPRTDDTMHDSPPRRRRKEEIHRSKPKVPDAPRRHPTSARASQSLSSSASMRVPNSTMPLLMRSATVSDRRPVKGHLRYEEEDIYRNDRRRSDYRRDASPPSAHHYRSTPDSRRSSRSSLPPSDDETDPTIESQDEEDARKSETEVRIVPADRRRRHRRERRIQEPIIEEPDDDDDNDNDNDDASRHTPSLDERRSPSRHSSDRHERRERREHREHREHRDHRDRRDQRETREYKEDREPRKHRHESRKERRRDESVEVDEPNPSSGRKQSSKKYYASEAVYIDKAPSSLRRSNTTSGSQVTTARSVSSTTKRSSAFFGGFFGSSIQAQPSEKPEKTVECVVCMDDVAPRKAAKLKCGHRMCTHCLKRSFKLSVKDPQHMPPKCCSSENIPLKHVEKLFDLEFKKNWNKKFAEYSSRNRVYCPSRRCGEWIKPENIHREDGRKIGKCGRCKMKVCCRCNGKWHESRDCPRDEETNRFLEQAKEEGWQRCYKCKAMVELKEGCNHMTCRCGAEFCMICGAKWKSCECPWFNYDAVENDRLEHMQIPIPTRNGDRDRYEHHDPPSPRDFRPGVHAPPTAARPRPQNYEEELYLRRLQEQRDEHMARRLQLDDYDEAMDDYTGGFGDIHGIGNSAGHFMNDDYRRRPENISVPPPPPHQQNPFDRANTVTDYISGVNRARGVRATSLERRLADRFNADLRQSPRNSPTHSHHPLMSPHGPPPPPSLQTAATMPSMPIAPVPPPAAPIGAPMMRRHTMEEDLYNNAPGTWPSERSLSGRIRHDYESEAMVHTPLARRQHQREPPRQSVMAGLGGPGRGMGRVFEWRTHVEPGAPEGEPITA